MINFTETLKEFNTLVEQSRFIEALDKFYDQNIISADNSNEPVKGLANLRKAVESFLSNTESEKIELRSSIIEKDLSVALWHYIFTNNKIGKLDYQQVSVQHWKDGKIIQENHLYNLG